jgi:hypothetical protein
MHNFARPTFYIMLEQEMARTKIEIRRKRISEEEHGEINRIM